MNYNQIQDFLHDNIEPKGSVLGLDALKGLLKGLGNPEQGLKYIHITGTNGKGSVGAMVESILLSAGYKVGRFSSPAVIDKFETITYNRKNITKKFYQEGYSRIIDEYKAMEERGENTPTVFETEFALALLYFQEKKPDICIVEVGMGGDTDATNVIPSPEVAILTDISLEHQVFLGKTLTEIAGHKAGIIKKGCSVVSSVQDKEVKEVITAKCKKEGCDYNEAEPSQVIIKKEGIKGITFNYKNYKKISTPLAGEYQISNIATAMKVIERLKERGLNIKDDAITEGMKNVYWPCRFEMVSRKPVIILDGAHNVAATTFLMESIEKYGLSGKLIYIVGVLKDKAYEKMAAMSADKAKAVITITPPDNPRALSAYVLAEEFMKHTANVTAADSIEDALFLSKAMAGDGDAILVWGSLSYLGRVEECIKNK